MAERVKRRDADRSRAAILDAAEELFAADGFDAVTLAQIGARAGVSRGTPGYFFGTKEALYRVVVERAAATLRAFAETLRTRDGFGSRSRDTVMAETVDAFLELLLARRSVVRIIDRESGAGLMEGEPHADALTGALTALGPDAPRAALTILSLCWFPLSHPNAARALGVNPDDPDFRDHWRRQILAALAGLSATPIASRQLAPTVTTTLAPTAPPSDPVSPEQSPPAESSAPAPPAPPQKKKKRKKGKKKSD